MNSTQRAIVARTVDLYITEIDEEPRTVRFNIPANPDDADEFLTCSRKNIKIIDAFFADNSVCNKHFRDSLEIFVARAIDEIFETDCCEILKQRLFPEKIEPRTQEELDTLLVETNSTYTDAVNECVRIFRNGLTDDSQENLEILESKLLKARVEIPVTGQYGMMTYLHEGTQYLVIQIAASDYPGSLLALRLPQGLSGLPPASGRGSPGSAC